MGGHYALPVYDIFGDYMETVKLTVIVTDTNGNPLDATIVVFDETEKEQILPPYELIVGNDYDITATCDGYESVTTDTFTAVEDIKKIITLTEKVEPFATIKDFELQTGKSISESEEARVEYLLDAVSNLIREEGYKVGVDVDAEIAKRPTFARDVRVVTVDVVNRVINQTEESGAYSQESQSALGYTWSGTYAVAGGGVAMSLMNNEMKRLGFNKTKIKAVQLWRKSKA